MPQLKTSHYQRIAITVLALGILLSGYAAWQVEKVAQHTDHHHFMALAERLSNEVTRRVRQFDYGLRGARALWPASTEVTRADFTAMVETRELNREFRGSLGLGFIRRVPRSQLDTFLQRTRADGAPDFEINTSGDYPYLYVIEYLAPKEPNLAAIGFDVASDPVRRIAAERAMLTGKSALTAPITLLQAKDEGSSFLIYYPVYQNGSDPQTEEDRRENLIGWTYMPIVAARILEGVTLHIEHELDFEVFHGTNRSDASLIFDADQHLKSRSKPSYSHEDYPDREFIHTKLITVGGETWTLVCSSNDQFTRSDRTDVFAVAIGGSAISFLIFGLIQTLAKRTINANLIAQKMTEELATTLKKVELLALVATRTTNAVVMCGTDRKITWINEGFTRITGYTLDEVIGKSPGQILQSELSDPATISLMRNSLNEGKAVRCEIMNRTKAGQDYWMDLDIVPLHDAEGKITGFMSVQLDISERKKNETLIKDQAERTELALAAGELGLWDWNIPTGKTLFDERWASMFGEKLEHLNPHVDEWVKRCHPDDLPIAQEALKKHFDGETAIYECLHRVKHRDGTWLWILDSGKVFSRTPNGEPLRMVGTHRNVTKQYTAELELQRQATALNHTGKLAKVGAWEYNLTDNTVHWSDQVRAIHEVDGTFTPTLESALAFYPDGAQQTMRETVNLAIESLESFDIELPLVTANGNRRWVRSMGEVVQTDGKATLLRGAFQDITESHQQKVALSEAKRVAEEASQTKADFLANMSHEIRTPMNAVIGMSDLLQNTKLNKDQAEFINIIRTSSETLLALLNDILDFSKIESGNLELESIPLDICNCAESAMEIVAQPAAEKNLDLLLYIEADVPPSIFGDKTRLCQIITNLLSNAVKFTNHGEVLLSISNAYSIHGIPGNNGLHFAISDTGIGIPEDRLDRLFKPFSQVDASITRQYGGTGLGLVICARLVKLMNGRIWVESRQNEGSTFHVEIPFRPAPAPKDVRSANDSAGIMGKRLLIVDDNLTSRRILCAQSEHWGLLPFSAGSAIEALQLIDRGDLFDLAIVDAQLPETNGYQLANEIRKRPGSSGLPIIALTSLGDTGEAFLRIRGIQVLTKPIKPSVLYQTLLQILPGSGQLSKEIPEPPGLRNDLATDHPLRILLCEDLPINQRVAALLLQRLGYHTEITDNGKEALRKLEQQSFDVIFMDVQMPEMDGLTCTRLICEKYPIHTRPWIIAMTANAQERDHQICLDAGMNDYISKPINGKIITQALIRASEELAKRK